VNGTQLATAIEKSAPAPRQDAQQQEWKEKVLLLYFILDNFRQLA